MSNYIYITKEGKQKQLDYYHNHKNLFELVTFSSIGRWRTKPKIKNEKDIEYLLYKIQNHCITTNKTEYLNTLKVKCLATYILFFDWETPNFTPILTDLNVQPYGFFFTSIELFQRKYMHFNNTGMLKVIPYSSDSKNKDLIDLKFELVLKYNKDVFDLNSMDFIESMHTCSQYERYYKKAKENGFYRYDIPQQLQKFFKVNKNLNKDTLWK